MIEAMRVGEECWEVVVHGLNEPRRLAPMPDPDHKGRATKRDRQQIIRFREGQVAYRQG